MNSKEQNLQFVFVPCRHDINVSLSSSAILELSGRPERPSVAAQPRITPQLLNHYTTQIFTDHGRLAYSSGSGSQIIFICSTP